MERSAISQSVGRTVVVRAALVMEPVGDAYTSETAASATSERVEDPLEDPGVLEAGDRSTFRRSRSSSARLSETSGRYCWMIQVDQGTKIGDVVGAGHFYLVSSIGRSRRPGCGGLGGSPGCGRRRCLRRPEPGGVRQASDAMPARCAPSRPAGGRGAVVVAAASRRWCGVPAICAPRAS